MNGVGAVGLQGFDDLFPRQQRLGLLAKLVDFLDLLVEFGDLGLQQLVPAVLILYPRVDDDVNQRNHRHCQDRKADRQRYELALPCLALLLAVGKKIKANHWKLRSARPQAMSNSGASCASCRGRT